VRHKLLRLHFSNSSRVVGQTQLRDLAAHPREFLPETSRPLKSEGAGNAGRPMRPRV
jgi:hypothetical protein